MSQPSDTDNTANNTKDDKNSNQEQPATNPNAKYILNNNDNTNTEKKQTVTNNTNDKDKDNDKDNDKDKDKDTDSDDIEEKKDDVTKDKSGSGSSYYLYKSTDKEEAKKYAPKKLDDNTAQIVESQVKSQSKGSTWNTGATMEQFDYSEWMKQRIEALLLDITFKNSSIKISEVVKVEGSATILLIRGKYRPGYDIGFECKWKGYTDPNYVEPPEKEENNDKNDSDDSVDKERKKIKKASGILKMHDITSEDDPEDWEYEASIKKKSKVNKAGLSKVKNDRESVILAIHSFVKELKAKKG